MNIIEKLWLMMVPLLNLRMYSRGSSRLEHETDWSLLMRRSEKNVPSCVATWHGWMKSMDSKSFFQTVTERPDLLPQYLDAAKDSSIKSPNLQMLVLHCHNFTMRYCWKPIDLGCCFRLMPISVRLCLSNWRRKAWQDLEMKCACKQLISWRRALRWCRGWK